MLRLRFEESWSYRKLAAKYGMDHKGIQLRCRAHAKAYGLTDPIVSRGPGRPRKSPEERKERKTVGRPFRGPFSDPAKLKEMLDLRFKEGRTLEHIGVKYGVTREAIRLQCKKHEHEYPDRVGVHNYRPTGGHKLTSFADILAERGETVEEYTQRISEIREKAVVARQQPRVKLMDDKELRDEFGERINRGRSYKEYLREQYPHLSMKKLKERNSERGL